MKFQDSEFDIIFDKGTMDALLSNGENESGENELVHKMLFEVFRVLKVGGTFWLISGNGSFITFPYLYQLDWNIFVEPLQRTKKPKRTSEFANLPMFLYSMKKEK